MYVESPGHPIVSRRRPVWQAIQRLYQQSSWNTFQPVVVKEEPSPKKTKSKNRYQDTTMRDLKDSSPFQASTCMFFYFLADPPPQDRCALPSHVNHMFSDTTAVLAIMNCLLEWETKTTLLHGSALAPPPASHTSKHTEDSR